MIRHIVCFKFSDRDSHEEIAAEAKQRLEGLVGKIAQIRSIEAGVNVLTSSRAYDLALTVTFDSFDDLAAYQIHPDHELVLAWLREQAEAVVAVDYEV